MASSEPSSFWGEAVLMMELPKRHGTSLPSPVCRRQPRRRQLPRPVPVSESAAELPMPLAVAGPGPGRGRFAPARAAAQIWPGAAGHCRRLAPAVAPAGARDPGAAPAPPGPACPCQRPDPGPGPGRGRSREALRAGSLGQAHDGTGRAGPGRRTQPDQPQYRVGGHAGSESGNCHGAWDWHTTVTARLRAFNLEGAPSPASSSPR